MTQLAIDFDLRALADDSERGMPEFTETVAQLAGGGSPYRDDRPGAEARRRALIEDRLLELALLPIGFERVFVHRVARAAAGAAVLLAAAAMMVGVVDPWTGRMMSVVSGIARPVLAPVLIGFAALGAYVVAGLFAERHFERRLRASVGARGEMYGDIERLEAIRPLGEVRRMVARVDAAATALPLAGATLAAAVCGFLSAFSFVPDHLIAEVTRDSLGPVALVSVLVIAFTFELGRACTRERRSPTRPGLLAVAEHWGTLISGAVVGVVVLWYGARVVDGVRFFGAAPGEASRVVVITAAVAAVILPLTWGLLFLRRREEQRL